MKQIKPCRPYHARTAGRRMLQMPDGVSFFKVYFVSIVGRDDPSRYEWRACGDSMDAFMERFAATGMEGVGCITAFPHITKVFQFAPAAEILMHVRAFNTADLAPLDLTREDGFMEFACYAEAVIAADEYRAWAGAASVEEYAAYMSAFDDGPIANPGKLAHYARGNGPAE